MLKYLFASSKTLTEIVQETAMLITQFTRGGERNHRKAIYALVEQFSQSWTYCSTYTNYLLLQ